MSGNVSAGRRRDLWRAMTPGQQETAVRLALTALSAAVAGSGAGVATTLAEAVSPVRSAWTRRGQPTAARACRRRRGPVASTYPVDAPSGTGPAGRTRSSGPTAERSTRPCRL